MNLFAMRHLVMKFAAGLLAILIAGIILGDTLVFAGTLTYRWLFEHAGASVAIPAALVLAPLAALLVLYLGGVLPRVRRDHAPSGVIEEQVSEHARNNTGEALIASIIVGFAMGFSPRLRRALLNFALGDKH